MEEQYTFLVVIKNCPMMTYSLQTTLLHNMKWILRIA